MKYYPMGKSFDMHESEWKPTERFGYSVSAYHKEEEAPQVVEVTGDQFDEFFLKHYPNCGIEHYGPRPASDDPIRFIHATPDDKIIGEYHPKTRIGVVIYKNGKPDKFQIVKSVWDAKQ